MKKSITIDYDNLILIDTNILIYALHVGNEKRNLASKIVLKLGKVQNGVLSIQTLCESYAVMTRKIKPKIEPETAMKTLSDFAESWKVVGPTTNTFLKALEGVRNYKISFWDSMQWAVALENNIGTILTEDLNHGQWIESVQIINPFRVANNWKEQEDQTSSESPSEE